ncbi:MAG: LON peptidase substrate-binding domain-containing protein [Pseudomonadales bacterium]|nr:LON peptidase substrate-binding domain-containing protein [Pseudomonadales bacterium]MBO6657019.1 LON peptidase substrate-binding domain-containing protein [Pseudomonadales bacterium]
MKEIQLFPLPLVLFPGGRLPLQIFETRYLDMVKRCLRDSHGFGVVMITDGNQILSNPEEQLPDISHCGTYCEIVDFDQQSNGVLSIVAEGKQKFAIRDQYELPDRLMMAQVEFIEEEEKVAMPEEREHLSGLLESLMSHEAVQRLGLSCDLGQAVEVSARLTELLPCPNHFKQRLLELKDPLVRLSELDKLVERMQKSND